MKRTTSAEPKNPFAVQTPEDIPAKDVVSLFVDVFGDFYHIPHPGHTFLNGPRGSGKSMMFRFLEPDCQQIKQKASLRDLDFFAVYVPIKNTEIKLTEFRRLENSRSDLVLGEHFLVTYASIKFFTSLLKVRVPDADGRNAKKLREYFLEGFRRLLAWSGWTEKLPALGSGSGADRILQSFQNVLSQFHGAVLTYLRGLALTENPSAYQGPLLGYLDFLLPLIKDIKSLGFMPSAPIFLLIDDADNLNLTQTKVLNAWVSSRTSEHVSLKISTQMTYKTYLTPTGQAIASPHDFSEVNISSVYTSSRNLYLQRVTQIVHRRLKMHKISVTPKSFFPIYEKQEKAIAAIAQQLLKDWATKGRGYRASDDATRYARPNYIKGLQGPSKSGSTYKYAGFVQLVHLSSGIIRFFLEAASLMYGEMRAKSDGAPIDHIDPSVQDDVVREQAREFFFAEFDKLEADEGETFENLTKIKKLRNLIQALGGTFHEILVSDASERRVFSIAFSDEPDAEVLSVFKAGVRYGYFHESSIGNKEGTGRTRLYILSRRLAPVFTLDPTSFAGYKFMTTARLREAMERPKTFLRTVRSGGVDTLLENAQLPLFEDA
jgi:hypothetical protein